MRKYIEGIKEHKKNNPKSAKVPTCYSYKTVCSAIEDPLLPVKLASFQTMASDIEPFLTYFQSNDPLAPLLYESLLSTMRQIMIRFIKTSILDSTNIIDIDLQNKSNFKDLKDIDIGFSTRTVLNKVVKLVEEMRFRKEFCEVLVMFCQLLFEKSPLRV